MQFRQNRLQDEKDVAFETLGGNLEFFRSTSVKLSEHIRNDNFSPRQLHDLMALESSRLAELKYAISAAWHVRKKTYGF